MGRQEHEQATSSGRAGRRAVLTLTAAVSAVVMSAGAAFAADCYVANKPTGPGQQGIFTDFGGTDFFYELPDAEGLDDAHYGKALPEGARGSGPGDGCGYGIDSYEACLAP